MENFLVHYGYAALILLAFIECVIPIPSEITFGFAGVLAYQGHLNLVLVIILGTLAELAGSYVGYGIGRVAERPVIERFGRYLLITKADLDRAERFLEGRGAWAIPLGRALPLVRALTSIAAGFAGVRPLRFGVLSLIGTFIYATVMASLGYAVGSAWSRVEHDISLGGYVIAVLLVAVIAAFIIHRVRELRRESRESEYDEPDARRPERDHDYDEQAGRPARNYGDERATSRPPREFDYDEQAPRRYDDQSRRPARDYNHDQPASRPPAPDQGYDQWASRRPARDYDEPPARPARDYDDPPERPARPGSHRR